jgi:hypothetical protein
MKLAIWKKANGQGFEAGEVGDTLFGNGGGSRESTWLSHIIRLRPLVLPMRLICKLKSEFLLK